MAGKAGERLTDDEVREFAGYHNAQITPPPKFDGVVIENTTAAGPIYRYQTDAEAKAAKATADAAATAVEDQAANLERMRAEASKRGVEVPPVPEAPVSPTPDAPARR